MEARVHELEDVSVIDFLDGNMKLSYESVLVYGDVLEHEVVYRQRYHQVRVDECLEQILEESKFILDNIDVFNE